MSTLDRREFIVTVPPEISGDVLGSKEYAKERAVVLLSKNGMYPVGDWNFYQITGEAGGHRSMYFTVEAAPKVQLSLL